MFFLENISGEHRNKFERVYYTYRQEMFQAACEILGDVSLSEDAVSEAFIRVLRNLDKIDENNTAATRSFLGIICRNVARTMAAKRNMPDYCTEEDVESIGGPMAEDPAEVVIGRESIERMAKAIEKLKPIYRDVFLLRRVYQFSREQIADVCGISVEAVKKRLAYAKAQILKEMEKEESGNGQ